MSTKPPKIDFDILIDSSLDTIGSLSEGTPSSNKNLLSLVNDYEGGKWRYDKFRRFVWDNIAEAALSAEERKKLADKSETQLEEAASNLRLSDDKGKGSELAEILLYGIMKHHYGAVSAVPKIYYKQNSQDYAKGADSVHIVINEEEKKFSLWLGEAKFYEDIRQAMLEAIESIKKTLAADKLKRESKIITGLRELDGAVNDPQIIQKIKTILSPEASIDLLKPVLHIPFCFYMNARSRGIRRSLLRNTKQKSKRIIKIRPFTTSKLMRKSWR